MDGMLSQDEINALLNGMSADDSADNETSETPQESNESASDNTPNTDKPEALSDTEKDAVGEISNISMGTAATTLSSLLNQKVNITTPRVEVADWDKLSRKYDRPCVMLQIRYKEGIDGNNVLILKERDVKIITDLMMGGTGNVDDGEELTDLHLSAIGEAIGRDRVLESPLRLYELEEALAGTEFVRASKSLIVNFDHVRALRPYLNARLELVLDNGESVIASRQYAPAIKQKIGL